MENPVFLFVFFWCNTCPAAAFTQTCHKCRPVIATIATHAVALYHTCLCCATFLPPLDSYRNDDLVVFKAWQCGCVAYGRDRADALPS